MIETVARAIFEAWAKFEGSTMTWDEAIRAAEKPDQFPKMAKIVPLARAEARAAIKAMGEPSEAMIEAALPALTDRPPNLRYPNTCDYDAEVKVAQRWTVSQVLSRASAAALTEEKGT